MRKGPHKQNDDRRVSRILFAFLSILAPVLAAGGLAHARDLPQAQLYGDGASPFTIIVLIAAFVSASALVVRMYRKVATDQRHVARPIE